MIVTTKDIKWGSYTMYEGPVYYGKHAFSVPDEPSETDKRLAVLSATEGNCDAVNMYDRCIVSVGQIQWCEAGMFGVSRMLGRVCDDCGIEAVLVPLKPALEKSNAEFKKVAETGLWRFFIDGKEVKTLEQQQRLFLSCDGKKGSWDEASKEHAKTWAAAIANVWDSPKARESQSKFTGERLMSFAMPEARKILFDEMPDEGMIGATRAAFLSFAANLPVVANKVVTTTMLPGTKWSREWCIALIKHLTFDPGIAIYPTRYNKIRPALEKHWVIELPKDSAELRSWEPPTVEDTPQPLTTPKSTLILPDPPARDLSTYDAALEPINNRRMTLFDAFINFIKFIVSLLSRNK